MFEMATEDGDPIVLTGLGFTHDAATSQLLMVTVNGEDIGMSASASGVIPSVKIMGPASNPPLLENKGIQSGSTKGLMNLHEAFGHVGLADAGFP